MKAPIDPSEPLFPLRYNAPVCQYYMKHGTCKFGQACKFHHPPQIAGTSSMMSVNTNTVLVNIPISQNEDRTQTMWKTKNDSNVQLLPQRLDEPNCIYFLKNGRCKYGASCRYHHPLNYHISNDRRGGFEEGRSRQHQDLRSVPKVHYVTALPPGSMQQGHFVVADGTVTFLSLDGNTPAHVVSIPQIASMGGGGKEGVSIFTTPGTIASSTSSTSIASSFETPISNVDPHESSGSIWNRKSSINAGGYNLPRVVSTGNAQQGDINNTPLYYNDTNVNNLPTTWRGTRSSSFDHTRPRSSSFNNTLDEELPRSGSVQSSLDERARRPRSSSMTSPMVHGKETHQDRRVQRQPREVDDGLSMMTSALLTMLDTPEEAAAKAANQGYEFDEQQIPHSYTNIVSNKSTAMLEDSRECHNHTQTSYFGLQNDLGLEQHNANFDQEQSSDPDLSGMFSIQQENQDNLHQIDRIQSWQVIHENSQFSSSQPPTSQNVGLYY